MKILVSSILSDFVCIMEPGRPASRSVLLDLEPHVHGRKDIRSLGFSATDTGTKLIAFHGDDEVIELYPGFFAEHVATLEPPTKAIAVFSCAHFPSICLVSTIGSSLVFENREGKLTELDQNQTRFGLSDSTIYVGDCMRNVAVQATKTWVNLVSASGNAVFRPPNGERVVACSSKSGVNRIALGLGEGDLRGKGRVCLLEVSPDGQIKEISRKDLMQDVIDVSLVNDETIIVATNDNSIYHLIHNSGEQLMKTKTHLKLNIPLRSVSCFSNGDVVASSSNGVIVRLRFDPTNGELGIESHCFLTTDPLSLSDSTRIDDQEVLIGLSPGKCYVLSNDLEVTRIYTDQPVGSLVVTLENIFSVSSGDVVVSKRPPFFGRFPRHVFSSSRLAQLPCEITSLIQPDPKREVYFITCNNDSPILLNPTTRKSLTLLSLEPVHIATRIGQDGLVLVAGSTCLSLIEIQSDSTVRTIWSVPFPARVRSVCVIADTRFALTTDAGLVQVYSVDRNEIPILFSSVHVVKSTDLEVFSMGSDRFFLVDRSTGRVYSCFYSCSNQRILYTSVSPDSWEEAKVTSCCVVNRRQIVQGSGDGRIRLVQIPHSVDHDEESGMHMLLTTNVEPEMCMCVNELVMELSTGSPIVSLVSKDGVIYFSTGDGNLGVVREGSPLGAWTWI